MLSIQKHSPDHPDPERRGKYCARWVDQASGEAGPEVVFDDATQAALALEEAAAREAFDEAQEGALQSRLDAIRERRATR